MLLLAFLFPGCAQSAAATTNDVSLENLVYEREIKRDGGRNYPEILFEELRAAWAREQNQLTSEPERPQEE